MDLRPSETRVKGKRGIIGDAFRGYQSPDPCSYDLDAIVQGLEREKLAEEH